jgi:hypothetical protein
MVAYCGDGVEGEIGQRRKGAKGSTRGGTKPDPDKGSIFRLRQALAAQTVFWIPKAVIKSAKVHLNDGQTEISNARRETVQYSKGDFKFSK